MRKSALLFAALFWACLPAQPMPAAENEVTLRIEVPPTGIRLVEDACKRAALEAFLVKHPEVKIDPYVKLQIPGPRGEASFYMAMAGEEAPDALYVYERSMQKYIDQDFLYPLNEYLTDDIKNDPLFKKLAPAITRKGKIYGVPALAAIHAILYRKDLFAQAGLDPEKPPANWDEWLEMSRKLTYPDQGQYGFLFPGAGGAGWRFSNLVWAAGGEVVRMRPEGWRLSVSDPREMEVFTKDQCRKRPDGMMEAMTKGEWTLMRDEIGTTRIYQMADDTWIVDKVPGAVYPKEWTKEKFEAWKKANIDKETPPGIVALEFLRKMKWDSFTRDGQTIKGGCMRIDSQGLDVQLLQQGKTTMLIASTTGNVGSFLEQGLDPSQIGFAPLPAGPELTFPDPASPNDPTKSIKRRLNATMIEGEFWGINSLIGKDKEKRDATWKYIRFLISDQAKAIHTRVSVESGWAMRINPKWLQKFGYETEVRRMPKSWVQLYDNVFDYGQLEPYAPGYDQAASECLAQLDDVLLKQDDPGTVLRRINSTANQSFFSSTPKEVMESRRVEARWIVGGLAGVVAILGFWKLAGWIRKRRRDGGRALGKAGAGMKLDPSLEMMAWFFMIPALLTILVWSYYPLLRGAVLAFQDYKILESLVGSVYIGLDNFINVVCGGGLFWQAMGQTFIYVAMALSLGFPAPIILAFILSEIPRGSLLFRTIFYLPAVTSGLVVMFLWKMMYDDSEQGIFNQGISWLTTTNHGQLISGLIFLAVWLVWIGLLMGLVTTILRQRESKGKVLPLVLLAASLPFWYGFVVEAAGGAMYYIFGVQAGLNLINTPMLSNKLFDFGWAVPLQFAVQGGLRLVVVLATVLGIRMWMDVPVGKRSWLESMLPVALVVLGGASVMARMEQAIVPTNVYTWLADPAGYWAMLWVIVPGIWAGIEPGCIIYLAAIKSIPEDLYEAADVDGAGPFEKSYHITFQYLKPLILINFVGAFVGTFRDMSNILVMTGGGPSSKTMTIGMDIFFNAFTHLKFGYATAEAWIMGSLLIGFTVYQLRILKRLRFTRGQA